jgi:16S rRNA (uracil1498-N3)-methyltransferase
MRDYTHFLFYSCQITESSIVLDYAETTHAVNVLRLKQNQLFNVTDGHGQIFTCILERVYDGQAHGNIVDRKTLQRINAKIHLNIGIPDRDAMETVVTSCTAMGVERITPVICTCSQDQWWNKLWPKHYQRLQSKMISAMKQSLYPFLPALDNPVPLEKALENCSGKKITADPEGESLCTLINTADFPVSCFVGPPGGYSEKELSLLREQGSTMIKIAPTRLRTELASIVLCAQLLCIG